MREEKGSSGSSPNQLEKEEKAREVTLGWNGLKVPVLIMCDFCFCFCFFGLSRAVPAAYGSSQAKG